MNTRNGVVALRIAGTLVLLLAVSPVAPFVVLYVAAEELLPGRRPVGRWIFARISAWQASVEAR